MKVANNFCAENKLENKMGQEKIKQTDEEWPQVEGCYVHPEIAKIFHLEEFNETSFLREIKSLAQKVHAQVVRCGFWEEKEKRNKGELIALLHSELNECLEAIRKNNPPDDKIPEFSGVEAELADVILRVLDMSEAFGYRIGEAMLAKVKYNETRSYKYKQF